MYQLFNDTSDAFLLGEDENFVKPTFLLLSGQGLEITNQPNRPFELYVKLEENRTNTLKIYGVGY